MPPQSHKNNKTQENEVTYRFSEMVEDGKKYILKFKNNLWNKTISDKFPFQIGIAIPLKSDVNGFPSKEENSRLLNLEEEIIKVFAQGEIAIFVGTITGEGVKEFILYTGKPKEAVAILENFREKIKHHELQCIIREDKNWEVYNTYCPQGD